jgi:tRNA (cytidine/uridine-2'-O-)-methyltransferase
VTDKALKRAAMDYAGAAEIVRHSGWTAFLAEPARRDGRLVLFTTQADSALPDFAFGAGDTLLFGRESAGVPPAVHEAAEARVSIPIAGRSLNVTVAAGIAVFEALRQTGLNAKAIRK